MNDLKERLENAIRHIETAVDLDPWASRLAVESMKIRIAAMETSVEENKEKPEEKPKGYFQKNGWWVNGRRGNIFCSVCGAIYEGSGNPDRCPSCQARMW